jgi:hypothetical protein
MAAGEADLTGFLESAGRSLADAQGGLVGEIAQVPTTAAISEAELEVKATIERMAAGRVALQPISSGDARKSDISPGLLSTITVRYVMAAEDTLVAPPDRPAGTADRAIEEVSRRQDVKALDEILGGLSFEATFVPRTKTWLVTATDQEGRLVRETLVPDRGS